MVAPTYQELAADKVIGFGSCKDLLTILLLASAVIMLKETFEYQDCHVSMLLDLEIFANMEKCEGVSRLGTRHK